MAKKDNPTQVPLGKAHKDNPTQIPPEAPISWSYARHQVPVGESTKESGPPRLYVSASSTSIASSKESGARRLFASPAIPASRQGVHRRTSTKK